MNKNSNFDLTNLPANCDQAIEAGDETLIQQLADYIQSEAKKTEDDSRLAIFQYYLGNLSSGLSRIRQESADGWRTDNYPLARSNAIDHYRECLKLNQDANRALSNETTTNLGIELAHQERGIEALAYWNPDFNLNGDTPFVSACSRSRELLRISKYLNDDSHSTLFNYESYRSLKKLKENENATTHGAVLHHLQHDEQANWLIKYGDKNFKKLANWQDKNVSTSSSPEEKAYRSWCLKKGLFANPINLLTENPIADRDILQFPNHTVRLGEGPFLPAAFSSAKREYCFGRFLAYEGSKGIHPAFEDKALYLTDTLDYALLDGSTEKLKTSLRVCFGVLDSLAFILNRYFRCEGKQPSFSSRWIKNCLAEIENPFIDALYWLACDLTDTDSIPASKWKAPRAGLSEIRKLRNSIEHGWLRIASESPKIWKTESDFAQTITPADLKRLVLLTLKVTNSALLYLTLAVKFHELQSGSKDDPTLPMITPLIDDPGSLAELFRLDEDPEE